MMTGKELKTAIRGTGLTVEEAAKKMKISRQTLSAYFGRAEIDEEIVNLAKSSLQIVNADVLNVDDYKEKYIISLEARIAEKEKAFDVLAEQSKAITRLLETNLNALANDMNVVLAKAAVQLQVSTFHYSKLAGISRKEAEIETDSVIAEVIGASGVKGS